MKTAPYYFPGMSGEALQSIYGGLIPFNENGVCRPKEDCVINDCLFLTSDTYPVSVERDRITVLGMSGCCVTGMIHMKVESFNEYFALTED